MDKFQKLISFAVLLTSINQMVYLQYMADSKNLLRDWEYLASTDELNKNWALSESIPPSLYPMDIMTPVIPPHQKGNYINVSYQQPNFIPPIRLDIRLIPPPMYRVELSQRPFQPVPPDIRPPYPNLLPFTASTTNAKKSNTSYSAYNLVNINQTESDTSPMQTFFSGPTHYTDEDIPFAIGSISPQNENFSAFNTLMQDTETNVIDTWNHPSAFNFLSTGWFPKVNEMERYLDPPLTQPSLQYVKEQEGINMHNLVTKRKKGDGKSVDSVDELNRNSALRESFLPSQYPMDTMSPVIPTRQKDDYVNVFYQQPDYINRFDIRLLSQRPFQTVPPDIPQPASTTNATKSNTSHSAYSLVKINQTESDNAPMHTFFFGPTRHTEEDIPFVVDSISLQNKNFSVFNTPLQDTENNVIDTRKHPSAFNFVPAGWFPKLSEMKQSSLQDIEEQESININNLVSKRKKGIMRFIPLKKGTIEKKVGTLKQVKRQFTSFLRTIPNTSINDQNGTFQRVMI